MGGPETATSRPSASAARAPPAGAMSFSYSPQFFTHFPKYHAPHLKPGEEHKDPVDDIRTKCLASCSGWLTEYNNCKMRIASRTDVKGDCKGQFEEMVMCQDHCVAHEIFHHVK